MVGVSSAMEILRNLAAKMPSFLQIVLGLLYFAAYVDVPLPLFHGRVGIKMKVPVDWMYTILGEEKEKDANSDPTKWWTNDSRFRPYYEDIAAVIAKDSPLRDLALTLLSTPSSSASAERVSTNTQGSRRV